MKPVAIVAAALLAAGCSREQAPPPAASAPSGAPVASAASAASAPAAAASAPIIAPVAVNRPGDAERAAGATLAAQGAQGAGACNTCHGAQGEGQAAAGFPRLAGQGFTYLLRQLDTYADGSRKNAVMAPIAAALQPPQRRAAAAHFASLPASAASAPAVAQPAGRGAQLARLGDNAGNVPACANCHGSDGGGLGGVIPYLAGQHESYLRASLAGWRDGTRNNDPSGQMPLIAKALSDADDAAAAAFYAALPAPALPRDRQAAEPFASTASAVVSGPQVATAPQGVGTEQGAAVNQAQGEGGTLTHSGSPAASGPTSSPRR